MKRSTAVGLIGLGAIVAGTYGATEQRDCRRDASGNLPPGCSSSRGGGGGGGPVSSAGSNASSSSPGSTSTARSGFGATGAAHSGGS